MHLSVSICIHISTYAHVQTRVQTPLLTHIYAQVYIKVYKHVCENVYMHVDIPTCLCTCLYTCQHTHVHVNMSTPCSVDEGSFACRKPCISFPSPALWGFKTMCCIARSGPQMHLALIHRPKGLQIGTKFDLHSLVTEERRNGANSKTIWPVVSARRIPLPKRAMHHRNLRRAGLKNLSTRGCLHVRASICPKRNSLMSRNTTEQARTAC